VIFLTEVGPVAQPEVDRPLDELEELVAMRLLRLLNADVPLEDAQAIAIRLELDYHKVLSMVAAGCPPVLAARIVL